MKRIRLVLIILANVLATVLTVATVLVVVHLWKDHQLFHQIVTLLSRPASVAAPVTPGPPQ